MNNIQEDDWADDTWSRHSGMADNNYTVELDSDKDNLDNKPDLDESSSKDNE